MLRRSQREGEWEWERSGWSSASSSFWRWSPASCFWPIRIFRRSGRQWKRCCQMRASRSNRRAGAAPVPHRLEAFLEMLAAERGAARLTLAAYRNDLLDLAGFLACGGQALEQADG